MGLAMKTQIAEEPRKPKQLFVTMASCHEFSHKQYLIQDSNYLQRDKFTILISYAFAGFLLIRQHRFCREEILYVFTVHNLVYNFICNTLIPYFILLHSINKPLNI